MHQPGHQWKVPRSILDIIAATIVAISDKWKG